jgi:hypothetical protein
MRSEDDGEESGYAVARADGEEEVGVVGDEDEGVEGELK